MRNWVFDFSHSTWEKTKFWMHGSTKHIVCNVFGKLQSFISHSGLQPDIPGSVADNSISLFADWIQSQSFFKLFRISLWIWSNIIGRIYQQICCLWPCLPLCIVYVPFTFWNSVYNYSYKQTHGFEESFMFRWGCYYFCHWMPLTWWVMGIYLPFHGIVIILLLLS